MTPREPRHREPRWARHFDDELVGLDPEDPEARAFAQHLDRIRRDRPSFTVEGYLDGVQDFAESANRAQGGRYWAAVVVVVLLLVGVLWVVGNALVFVAGTWL
jgi:hypothetical protein